MGDSSQCGANHHLLCAYCLEIPRCLFLAILLSLLLIVLLFILSLLPEVVEHACSITSLMLGETLPSITKDMDTFTYRLPIGVCAGIAPFNFPAMIPLWMFPLGMVCGNTYLMKPSERVPGCTMLLTKMLQDAGAPDGTVNIIHGQHAGESIVFKQGEGACKMLHETVLYYTLYIDCIWETFK